MNQLYQYDPYTGGQSLPAYGTQYQNDGLINALLGSLTQQQILGAFTPQGQGGQSSGFLDMLMNGASAPVAAFTPAAPVAAFTPAAPVAAPVSAEEIASVIEPGVRNDGYDSGSLYGGDGYGLYGGHSGAKSGVNMADAYAQYAQSLGAVGQGNLSGAPMAELQEASSTHGGSGGGGGK